MDSPEQVHADLTSLIQQLQRLREDLPANVHRWQPQGEASAEAQLQFARILSLAAELRAACELLREGDREDFTGRNSS